MPDIRTFDHFILIGWTKDGKRYYFETRGDNGRSYYDIDRYIEELQYMK